MYICVDFDGTIVKHTYPQIGGPVPGAIEWMKEWNAHGAKIILWTMRSTDTLKEAIDYLKAHGVELYGVNENPYQRSWTISPKAYAHIYVDDAAYGCPLIHPKDPGQRPYVDWTNLGPEILNKLKDPTNV